MLSRSDFILFQASLLDGIGPKTLEKLADRAIDCDDLRTLASADARLDKALKKNPDVVSLAEEQLEKAAAQNIVLLTRNSSNYPRLLTKTPDSPYFIFAKGNLEALNNLNIAIVGSRVASERSIKISERLARHCVSRDYVVLSGLAEGCDWAAHLGALNAGGTTTAILPHGIISRVSKERLSLMDRIADEGGVLVSQFGLTAAPNKGSFILRDKVQAGVSSLTILIESKLDGGSLHACRASISYGRRLGVVEAEQGGEMNANKMLLGGDEISQSKMLGCSIQDLDRVFGLRSKNDYPLIDSSALQSGQ